MSKKNKIIIIIFLFLFLSSIIAIIKLTFNSGYKIYIFNKTNTIIENIEIKFKVGNVINTIDQIKPSSSWKTNIDTNDIQGENAIVLVYKDKEENYHEKTIVGYLEKGYNGKVNVFINKIDESGCLEITNN